MMKRTHEKPTKRPQAEPAAGHDLLNESPPPADAPKAVRLAWLNTQASVLARENCLKMQTQRDLFGLMCGDAVRSGDEARLRDYRDPYNSAVEALRHWRVLAINVYNLTCELLPDLDGKLPVTADLPDRLTPDAAAAAAAEWRCIEAAARRARLDPKSIGRKGLEARALGVLIVHPGWTIKQIAEELHCHPKSLSRLKGFTKGRRIMKSDRADLPRGSKYITEDGQFALEARDDPKT